MAVEMGEDDVDILVVGWDWHPCSSDGVSTLLNRSALSALRNIVLGVITISPNPPVASGDLLVETRVVLLVVDTKLFVVYKRLVCPWLFLFSIE